MDAELIAIGRVRRAVKDLSVPAQVRVLQYVTQGVYEAEQTRQRSQEYASGGNAVSRMSLADGGASGPRQQAN